jgi:hypothetical protein
MTIEHDVNLIIVVDNDLQPIQPKTPNFKREETNMTAKSLNAAGIFR